MAVPELIKVFQILNVPWNIDFLQDIITGNVKPSLCFPCKSVKSAFSSSASLSRVVSPRIMEIFLPTISLDVYPNIFSAAALKI